MDAGRRLDWFLVGLVALGAFACLAQAAEPAAAAPAAPESWVGETIKSCCYGGDFRLRQEAFDDIPRGTGAFPQNDYFRFRTRLWGQVSPIENVNLRARLVNEFREYLKPDDTDAWEFPEECIVDNLYLEAKNLFDGMVDARIGRQDLIYGTGKVILEGTPLDGSRTIYLDAAKVSLKFLPDTTIDLLGIYQQPENELAINTEDRDLTGKRTTDTGYGVYVMNKSLPSLPCEAYYLFKNEDPDTTADKDSDINTVGYRVMPKICGTCDGNIEAAYQFGETGDVDLEAGMLDALVTWRPAVAMSPSVGVGYYLLTGDDPKTADNEGWNPLWARYPQCSELYVFALGGYWSNLAMPYVNGSIAPTKWLKFEGMVGQLNADENGPGDGDERGLLATLWARFTIAEGVLGSKDKLSGHLLAEVLDPGDFHVEGETAHFLRWELAYTF